MMIKKDVLKLYLGLKSVENYPGVKFAYAVSKNLKLLEAEAQALSKAVEYSPEFQEYENKREAIAKMFALTDERGKAQMTPDRSSFIIDDKIGFDAAFKIFEAENKEIINRRDVQVKEYEELLHEKVDITLFKIKMDLVPEVINARQLSAISDIIEE